MSQVFDSVAGNCMDLLASLQQRQHIPELMDEPGLDAAVHRDALADLARINRLSFSARILWPSLRTLAMRAPGRTVRVLDVATGGGDVPLALARLATREKLAFDWHACDVSPTALEAARANSERARTPLHLFRHDLLASPLPGQYDVVMCSLFLHHLSEANAVHVLRRMAVAAMRRVLVNDLHRSAAGYALAWLGTRVLSRSAIVHFDGPVSVRSAFTPGEARLLARRAGLRRVTVSRHWPFRYLLGAEG